jgi:hypothetical protein
MSIVRGLIIRGVSCLQTNQCKIKTARRSSKSILRKSFSRPTDALKNAVCDVGTPHSIVKSRNKRFYIFFALRSSLLSQASLVVKKVTWLATHRYRPKNILSQPTNSGYTRVACCGAKQTCNISVKQKQCRPSETS